ncbi:MAG: hypothetical protein JST09_21310 [Bacteroidetes bacterium]|nr:hypothetical protein [Bacteroidota bacterium]MBS1608027.1 hypothetical protein [Bacteroidota bacterium]
MQTVPSVDLLLFAESLRKRGHNSEEIILQLRDKGAPDTVITETIEKMKALRMDRKRRMGFIYCGIGIFLLVAGCMITFLLFSYGNDIRLVMYGLTSLGVIVTLKGLVDLMGW